MAQSDMMELANRIDMKLHELIPGPAFCQLLEGQKAALPENMRLDGFFHRAAYPRLRAIYAHSKKLDKPYGQIRKHIDVYGNGRDFNVSLDLAECAYELGPCAPESAVCYAKPRLLSTNSYLGSLVNESTIEVASMQLASAFFEMVDLIPADAVYNLASCGIYVERRSLNELAFWGSAFVYIGKPGVPA